jgi:hypothetical protein
VGYFFDGHAQFRFVYTTADRVGATDVLAVNSFTQCEVLPLAELIVFLEFLWNFKSNGYAILGFSANIDNR